MRDESHLDDMRAAIRGDFERLEQRRGTQELMHVRDAEEKAEPEPSVVLATEPVEREQVRQVEIVEPNEPLEPLQSQEPVEPAEIPEPVEPGEDAAPASARPRSWLARLLGAIPPRQV